VGKINLLDATYKGNNLFQVGQLKFIVDMDATPEPLLGSAMKLLVRPEDVKVCSETYEEMNIVEGDVLKVTFLGSFCRVLLKVKGLLEDSLLVDMSHKMVSLYLVSEGSLLKLCIAPSDICYFVDEAHA
jgi:iron(III) transport system ATP-binding protein